MAYEPFGWENAPDGWTPGEPAPDGSENAVQTAERMEAFGAHILDQSGNILVQEADPGNDVPAATLWVEIDDADPPNVVAIHVAVPA